MATYIYALHCPIAKTVRYIGKTINPKLRFKGHLQAARTGETNHHTARWLRKLMSAGLVPHLEIIETLRDGECWKEFECFYIENGDYFGWSLTNTAKGGGGGGFTREEDRATWLQKVKAGFTAEVRARLSDFHKAEQNRPEIKAANSERMRRTWQDTSQRSIRLGAMREANTRPELKKIRSENAKKLWANPENRRRIVEKLKRFLENPLERQRRREATLRARANPDIRDAWIAAHTTPEVKAKQSESKIRQWQDPQWRSKMLDKFTPERRARQAELVLCPSRQAKIDAARNSPEYKEKRAATIRAKTQAKKDAMPPEELEAKKAAHRAKEAARSKAVYAAKKLAKLAAKA